ncbi:MAG: hypothetical protein WCQ89_20405 [Verrucomicrobiota bacterium]
MRALSFLVVSAAVTPLHAGPTDDAIIAAMKLTERPNYSWVTTVTDDARTYTITGRTTPAGFTRVQMPVVNRLRRKLGRGVTDTEIELIFRGNVACVVETPQGWRTPAELPETPVEPAPTSTATATEPTIVVNASAEWLPRRPSVRSGAIGAAPPGDRAPRARAAWWLYALILTALCVEWMSRRKVGLR